jgi:transcriptional regulator with XRE-family HTH domain
MKSQKILLGQRIRGLRKAKGYTQEKLAEMANLDYTSIGAIERGVFAPSLDTAHRLANALKIDIAFLIKIPKGKALTEKEIMIARINKQLETTDVCSIKFIDSIIKELIRWAKKNAKQRAALLRRLF